MRVTVNAPCRLDFAGGWTDVQPYPTDQGGLVVNAAIRLFATATVETDTPDYRLHSIDLDRQVSLADPTTPDPDDLLLLRAAVRMAADGPVHLTTQSDAPPGSGLGSSGALDVAMIAALDLAAGRHQTAIETAHRAWHLEAVVAGLSGGKQDQYAAAVGGFQQLRFQSDQTHAEGLALDSAFLDWLADHLVVCYTGHSRVSGATIARVMARYRAGDPATHRALAGLVDTAEQMAEALARGQVSDVGRLLTTNWRHQRALDQSMATPIMDQLEHEMNAAGSIGGKAAGAGAGGTMFFLVPSDPAQARRRAAELGMRVLPVAWAMEGARAC